MSRDDFKESTKRKLAFRAGGRCSKPGCDKICFLPGSEPEDVIKIGVAAHIRAASENGPRYDPNQSSEERRSIQNGIFLCRDHATLIDEDPKRFPVEKLKEWKKKHEEQIRGTADGTLLMPEINITKNTGITFSSSEPLNVDSSKIGNRVEHTLEFINASDFEYRSFGFTLTYPEMIEHKPLISAPPDCPSELNGENMDVRVSVSGGGSVTGPKRTHYGLFNFEAGKLIPGAKVEITIRSIPDPNKYHLRNDGKQYFHIGGEVRIMRDILEKQRFTIPVYYDQQRRKITTGEIHDAKLNRHLYVNIRRF